jgi:hypothetical protein
MARPPTCWISSIKKRVKLRFKVVGVVVSHPVAQRISPSGLIIDIPEKHESIIKSVSHPSTLRAN